MKTLNELVRQYPAIKIDKEDLTKFGFWPAHMSAGYVVLTYIGVKRRLQAHIVTAPEGYIVDHINRDSLDNRRINLRIATQMQNLANTSLRSDNTTGAKGVTYNEKSGKYRTVLTTTISGVKIRKHIGCFNTLEEAANAYDKEKLRYMGDFAALNNISSQLN